MIKNIKPNLDGPICLNQLLAQVEGRKLDPEKDTKQVAQLESATVERDEGGDILQCQFPGCDRMDAIRRESDGTIRCLGYAAHGPCFIEKIGPENAKALERWATSKSL